jgi:cell division protein FtsN
MNSDSVEVSLNAFKMDLFFWEVIVTVIVFTAVYLFLKAYHKKEKAAKEKNSKYHG